MRTVDTVMWAQLVPPPPAEVAQVVSSAKTETAVIVCFYRQDVGIALALLAVLVLVHLVQTVRTTKTR